jgi:hypothetical protein
LESPLKPNVGSLDRILRAVLGAALVLLALFGMEGGLAGGAVPVLLLVIGLVLLGTAATSRCPLYRPFGLSTR